MKKALPIGIEEFKTVIENGYYYVDKTDVIAKYLKDKNYISLFPRPRRFGKSLFISMLDNFFNIEYRDVNKNLFKGLKIEKSKYYKELSSKPVIKLNFKSLKQDNYEVLYQAFKTLIYKLYSEKRYLLDSLLPEDKIIFQRYLDKTADESEYQQSILLLSSFMSKYYKKNVVILIDEYDVPIQEGYLHGYYDKIISLIREVFSNALKGNPYVEFGIMTGVLRVSKESLFSDLNNVEVYGIVNSGYNEAFGFTRKETKELLEYYDLKLTNDVKRMYDGYNFNGEYIYNPWSILKYAKEKELVAYWVNTSGNELLINSIKNAKDDVKIIVEKLLSGEFAIFEYNDKVTYLDYNDGSLDNILNLLFVSGYLTLNNDVSNKTSSLKKGVLPNEEVKTLFMQILRNFLKQDYGISAFSIDNLMNAITLNNKEKMETLLNQMLPYMSYMDESEKFYHGYMLGLFSLFTENGYSIKSNREAGSGRFDLMIEKNDKSIGMILELKITDNEGKMEDVAKEALNQIETKEYYEVLVNDKVKTIYKYAIIFKGKKCIVR